jgi:hypothetical protein
MNDVGMRAVETGIETVLGGHKSIAREDAFGQSKKLIGRMDERDLSRGSLSEAPSKTLVKSDRTKSRFLDSAELPGRRAILLRSK